MKKTFLKVKQNIKCENEDETIPLILGQNNFKHNSDSNPKRPKKIKMRTRNVSLIEPLDKV